VNIICACFGTKRLYSFTVHGESNTKALQMFVAYFQRTTRETLNELGNTTNNSGILFPRARSRDLLFVNRTVYGCSTFFRCVSLAV